MFIYVMPLVFTKSIYSSYLEFRILSFKLSFKLNMGFTVVCKIVERTLKVLHKTSLIPLNTLFDFHAKT